MILSFSLERDPTQVGLARHHVDTALRSWGLASLAPEALLMTSELVSNAVLYGEAPIRLVVALRSTTVRVLVEDAGVGPALLVSTMPSTAAIGGRGLALVARLALNASSWTDTGGTHVWFELSTCDHLAGAVSPLGVA